MQTGFLKQQKKINKIFGCDWFFSFLFFSFRLLKNIGCFLTERNKKKGEKPIDVKDEAKTNGKLETCKKFNMQLHSNKYLFIKNKIKTKLGLRLYKICSRYRFRIRKFFHKKTVAFGQFITKNRKKFYLIEFHTERKTPF